MFLFHKDLKKKEFIYPIKPNQYISTWINTLLISRDNKLYIGTHNGLSRIDLNNEPLAVEALTSSDIVYCLNEDEYGNIYLSGYNLQILKLLENNFDMTTYIDKILEDYKKKVGK